MCKNHAPPEPRTPDRDASELITYGKYRTLNLTPLGYERIARNKPSPQTPIT